MSYIKINLPFQKKAKILALGAQSKSSFCFVQEGIAYLSEPYGDLSDLENFKFFRKEIERLQDRLGLRPKIIAHDLHPGYVSTRYGNDLAALEGLKKKAIQHHKAHLASSIVDNSIRGNVIGVVFDGTGYGLDGNIWGGEFFVGSIKGFRRVANLGYISMPGGEAAVREPWRMGLSYLYSVYGERFRDLGIDFLTKDKKKTAALIQIIDKRINSPLTSSMGRLFDAVSSIIGICDTSRYEAQAAIELEKILNARGAMFDAREKYNFNYKDKNGVIIIDPSTVIKGIVKDSKRQKNKIDISLKFHNAVCCMIKEVSVLLRRKYKLDRVSLSGGVFQNRYLSTHARLLLEQYGFRVYAHQQVPAHDGGIALGQAVLAGD